MSTRERIIEAAMGVFGRYGYRQTSMELVAQDAGLTRQALYHHFDSKEALFRSVVEAVHEGAAAAQTAAGSEREAAGGDTADCIAAEMIAYFRYFADCLADSAHADELLSEQQHQTRDLFRGFADRRIALCAASIERLNARWGRTLRPGLIARELARLIELAVRNVDFRHPAETAVIDIDHMVRLLVAGALTPETIVKTLS